jgi:hypothetical protein
VTNDQTRRELLRKIGVASGAVALAGCGDRSTGTPRGPPWQTGDGPERTPKNLPQRVRDVEAEFEFDRTVDLVAEGADPTGRRAVDGALADAVADETLAYLRPGSYLVTEPLSVTEFDRLGLVGHDAVLVPEEGYDDPLLRLGEPGDASELVVEGIDFDFRAESTGGRPIVARVDDSLRIRDVSVRGRQDVDSDLVRIDVADEDGSALVERLRLPDGGVAGSWDGDSGITGCEVGSDNRGDVAFVDCRIEGFPDNGLYADPTEGSVRVEGGYYANNGVANVRVNGGSGSVVRGVTVRCDEAREGVENMRGIRLRGGDSPVVENCLVRLDTVTSSDGGITVHSNLESATIRNSRVRVDADGVTGIRVKSPSSDVDDDGPIQIQNVSVEGAANEEAAIDVADRSNCVVERTCIRQTGRNRDGIRGENVRGRVSDALISVRGRPIAFEDSSVETTDVTIDRSPEHVTEQRRQRCRGWVGQ